MAKGQQRSNREAKKPKKSAGDKSKETATAAFIQTSRAAAAKPATKKS